MSRHLHFFATRGDLLPVLTAAEQKLDLRYTLMGQTTTKTPQVFYSVEAIPDFGIANCESAIGCSSYLTYFKQVSLKPRKIQGTGKYAWDQLLNPETIEFKSGGFWKAKILLYGRIATVSSHPDSIKIIEELRKLIKKATVRVNAFWVGREAEIFWKNGGRLTIAEQSPPEYDLKEHGSSL